MRIPTSHRHADAGTIDQAMTPMIDVVFLLLIFFVCASVGQTADALLPTELAAGGIAAELPPIEPQEIERLWMKLLRQGDQTVAELNGTVHPNLDDVSAVLVGLQDAGVTAEMPVVLDVGSEVPMGDAIRVYDECLTAGFTTINFAAGK
ncbi:MAG: biopolymer transporter ExbD [Planctomycetota bacterium]|nr:biopolymer transporter ExbD [Planctomycetaceae bacterium]MDQ3330149.1 biopolymer transporter ExbD [Planctomycetota bacterium]